MAMSKLHLSREQLSTFLKNHEQIRQFERLFAVTDELSVNPDIQGIELTAENAVSLANDALSQIAVLERAVSLLSECENKATSALDGLSRLIESLQAQTHLPAQRNDNSIATDYIDLPESGPHVTAARRLQWNPDDGTLDVGLYNDVVLQCGQEHHYYAKNTSGSLIANGTPVMFTGAVGASGKLTFGLAVSSGATSGDYMMGVTTQDIADDAFGYVTSFGLVRGFDTTGTPYGEVWADADLLYMNAASPGTLTKTQPSAPALCMPVAVVIHAGAGSSGSIFARFRPGDTVASLNDAQITSVALHHILQWSAANLRWENTATPRFGGATDYTEFEADGTPVAYGNATVWVDIDFPIVVRTTGPNVPILAALRGNILVPQWGVNDYNVCEGAELIHGWKQGSTIYWHIHVVTNGLDATDRYLNFEIEWCYGDISEVISAVITDVSGDLLIPANTTDRSHIVFSISNRAMTNERIGCHVYPRLRRIASAGTAPTSDPFCSMLQLHVECDTGGSRQIITK